jgi:hypothetical protein
MKHEQFGLKRQTLLGCRSRVPLGWIGALVLFFLPWMNVSCRSQDGREEMQTTLSGAQLAWGGGTISVQGKPPIWVLVDLSTLWKDSQRLLVGCLLSAYLLGLGVGIWFALVHPPGSRRARIGLALAALLLALLFGVSTYAWGSPFHSEPPALILGEWVEYHFTVWYFGSYLCNVWTVVSFTFECWRSLHSPSLGKELAEGISHS